jgi:polysaccharide export outer membrane protein
MNADHAHRRLVFTLAALTTVLAACTAPGMRMDIVPERQPGSSPADIRARADIYAIDAPTVAKMRQASAQAAQPLARPASFKPYDDAYVYLVGPQDELRITVFEHPELTNPSGASNELSGRIVNSDGKIFFPYVGDLQAGGRTVQQIQAAIAQGLTRVIRNPQVDVSVLRFRSQRIVVSGEVKTPGTVPITDVPPTLSEVISGAGGLTGEADLGNVTVTRGATSAKLDLYAYLNNGEQSQNVRLQTGDVVNVPDRRFNKVFVLGEAGRTTPQGSASLVMPRGRMSLTEALSDSGGLNPLTANAGQIYVIRGGNAKPQIFHLNASTPDALVLADQFDLRARDVVFVDAVPVARWGRIFTNVLPSAELLRLGIETRILTR